MAQGNIYLLRGNGLFVQPPFLLDLRSNTLLRLHSRLHLDGCIYLYCIGFLFVGISLYGCKLHLSESFR